MIGQTLRINPYEWNDEDYVCTRLEVYGCPLQGTQYKSDYPLWFDSMKQQCDSNQVTMKPLYGHFGTRYFLSAIFPLSDINKCIGYTC